jgi:hypothetical protein
MVEPQGRCFQRGGDGIYEEVLVVVVVVVLMCLRRGDFLWLCELRASVIA